jgi:hypothetical protein
LGSSATTWEPFSPTHMPKRASVGLHLLMFPNHYTKFIVLRVIFDHYVHEGFIIYHDLEYNAPLIVQGVKDEVRRRLVFVKDDEPQRLRLLEYVLISHPKLTAHFVDSMSALYLHYVPSFPNVDASRLLISLLSLIRKISTNTNVPYLVIHTTQQMAQTTRRFKPLSERLWGYAFDTTTSFMLDAAGRILMLSMKRGA